MRTQTVTLAAPVRPSLAATLMAAVSNLMWRLRVYNRWLTITTLAAPNPMSNHAAKGGEA